MTPTRPEEVDALAAVSRVVARSRHALYQVGVEISNPEFDSSGDTDHYDSEISVKLMSDGQLLDVLVCMVFLRGKLEGISENIATEIKHQIDDYIGQRQDRR